MAHIKSVSEYIEKKRPDALITEGGAPGLLYVTVPEKAGVCIMGQYGSTYVTRTQAKAIVAELIDIFDLFTGKAV